MFVYHYLPAISEIKKSICVFYVLSTIAAKRWVADLAICVDCYWVWVFHFVGLFTLMFRICKRGSRDATRKRSRWDDEPNSATHLCSLVIFLQSIFNLLLI
jgi:hypothetical protein